MAAVKIEDSIEECLSCYIFFLSASCKIYFIFAFHTAIMQWFSNCLGSNKAPIQGTKGYGTFTPLQPFLS